MTTDDVRRELLDGRDSTFVEVANRLTQALNDHALVTALTAHPSGQAKVIGAQLALALAGRDDKLAATIRTTIADVLRM